MSAFVLLSVAAGLGLALSLRIASPAWPRAITGDLHRFVTALALGMTGVHLLVLLVDSRSGIDLLDVVIPFVAQERALATGLGTLALIVLVATWVTTLMRARIGQGRWRALHRLAIVSYLAALGHGVLDGTDAGAPWAVFVYLASGVAVAVLLAARIARRRAERAPRAAARPAPAAPAEPTPRGASPLPPLAPRPPRRAGLPPL
jgi:predicted ferric reductase